MEERCVFAFNSVYCCMAAFFGFFFFFQAEDGIRDLTVTGVQTCALPISQQFGAAGFIPKSAPAEAIGTALQEVLDGGSWFPPMAAERSEADAALAARLAQLTPQQFRVLLCLADGLLNKQIAHELGLAENTVKVHVTAILKKLECYSRTQAAVLVKSLENDGTV